MEFGILGPLEVRRAGQAISLGGARQRALLAILLMHANRVVGAERLVELLWGEEPPESADHALQVYVSQLRKVLEPDGPPYQVLLSRPPGYALQVRPDELDANQFETLLEKAGRSSPDQAAAQLRQALDLWRGPALADFSSHAFALGEAMRLTEARLRAMEDRIEADLALGRHAELVGELQGLVAEHPLRERLRGQLMLALYQSGRQGEASNVYHRTRELLVEELGMEPGPLLQQLLKQILTQDPVLNVTTRPLRAEPLQSGEIPRGRAAMTQLSAQPPNARPRAQVSEFGEPGRPGQPFVGRTSTLATLTVALEQAQLGSGGLALVAGEAGIGKTRLVTELAGVASRLGVNVLWANCWDGEGTPPFWPWIELVRRYAGRREPAVLCEELGRDGAEIARLVPQLTQSCPSLATAPHTDPDESRFNLFDSLVGFLRRASDSQPLVLVIDDLHWADEPSLRLLKFAAIELRGSSVLIVGTYRDTEVAAQGPLARLLGELTGAVQHIMLSGLSAQEVSKLLGHLLGAEVSAERAGAIHARTNGNPFFVREIARLQAAQPGHDDTVPIAVREVVERRLGGLSSGCRSLLEAASVIGQEFEFGLVAEVAGLTPSQSMERLREAASARLAEVTHDTARFVHALVRETVYLSIDTAGRRRLHRRVATALERRHAGDLGGHLAELALHCREAGGRADLERAFDYAIRAGERSMGLFAYEHAASHFERGLQLLALLAPRQRERAGSLHLAIGRARIASGELTAARDSLQQAAHIGRELNDSDLLARAALSLGGEFGTARADDLEVQLLSEALTSLGPQESTLRAMLQARLARALLLTPQFNRRIRLAEEATTTARRLDDASTLAAVLCDRHQAIWFADPPELRLAMADEIVDLAERCEDRTLSRRGRVLRLADLMEIGDQERLRTELDVYARLLDEWRQLPHLWQVPLLRAALATLTGNFADAESLADEGLGLGRRFQQPGIDAYYGSVLGALRLMQGRLDEFVERLEHLVRAFPAFPSARFGLLIALSDAGRQEEAQTIFERLVAGSSVDLPQDHMLVFNLALLAIACLRLDDKRLASALYEVLRPYGPYNVRGTLVGAGCLGSTQHYLGLLATTLSKWDDAVDHLEAAVAANTRQGFLAAAVHSRHQLGRALVRRGQEGDHHRGRTQTAEAQVAAARHGIRLAPESQAGKMLGANHPLSPRELQIAQLVSQGMTNPEIAQRLFISKRTAETHVDHIKDKLGISTRAQLVVWILERKGTR